MKAGNSIDDGSVQTGALEGTFVLVKSLYEVFFRQEARVGPRFSGRVTYFLSATQLLQYLKYV